jgi:glucose/arabinose dehydrogenase
MLRTSAACAAAVAVALLASAPAGAQRPHPYARGVPEPTNLAFDDRGRLWVTSGGHVTARSNGVWLVRRRGARPVQVVSGLYSALGLAWHRGRLYVSHVVPARTSAPRHTGRVTAFWGLAGGRFRRSKVVVDGLPTGLHRVNSLAVGPNGRLYLGVGSQSDSRRSSRPRSATVLSFSPSGGGTRIEARGLRNPYGLAFVPGTSVLAISEHGRDDLGLRRPPEELNLVDVRERAPHFGFPDCYGQGGAACRGTRPAAARLAAHSAPGALAIAPGRDGAPVVYMPRFGSSFAARPTGGDVVAIRLERDGRRWRTQVRSFAKGLGRQNPLGAAVGADGRLYVSLWSRGEIVRFDLPRPGPAAAVANQARTFLQRAIGCLERLLLSAG